MRLKKKKIIIETSYSILKTYVQNNKNVTVDMGNGRIKSLTSSFLSLPSCRNITTVLVNIGNPHLICIIKNINKINLHKIAYDLKFNNIFPQGINIILAQLIDENHLRLKIFERGTGITPACGSGACAAALTTFKIKLTSKDIIVDLEGGRLYLKINSHTEHVLMYGDTSFIFKGRIKNFLKI